MILWHAHASGGISLAPPHTQSLGLFSGELEKKKNSGFSKQVLVQVGGSEQKKRGGGGERNADSLRTARSASVQQYKW